MVVNVEFYTQYNGLPARDLMPFLAVIFAIFAKVCRVIAIFAVIFDCPYSSRLGNLVRIITLALRCADRYELTCYWYRCQLEIYHNTDLFWAPCRHQHDCTKAKILHF